MMPNQIVKVVCGIWKTVKRENIFWNWKKIFIEQLSEWNFGHFKMIYMYSHSTKNIFRLPYAFKYIYRTTYTQLPHATHIHIE